ncbi:hypothetical protein WJX72_000483 [[Myrmecia] bisecta]|uniref:AAA+ ATPase domain-containing protein n=1 Tax=[Myrmecia] bisecta TaxID=41462 RepID=A0AAW1Q4G3_9CHLO
MDDATGISGAVPTASASEDDSTVARIHAWHSFLTTLRRHPGCMEFIYLNPVTSSAHAHNPYDLQIVPHQRVTPRSYFTMSAAGVTHFQRDLADFTPLDQFEREYFLYTRLVRLPLFRQFRLWKCFALWKRAVRVRKTKDCKITLERTLFLLNPTFRQTLLQLRNACCDLWTLRLHGLKPYKTYTLEELVSNQNVHKQVVRMKLQEFALEALEMAQQSCDSALNKLEADMTGTMARQSQLIHTLERSRTGINTDQAANTVSHGTAHGGHSRTMATLGGPRDKDDFSYATTASKRAEQRRFVNFIRLADYLLVLGRTTTTSQPPVPRPLIHMEILLDQSDPGHQQLAFDPRPQEFEQHLETMLGGFGEQLSVVERLLTHEDVRDHVEAGLNGRVEVAAMCLLDLVDSEPHMQLATTVSAALQAALETANTFLQSFASFREMVVANERVSAAQMRAEVQHQLRGLDTFRADILRYQQQAVDVASLPLTAERGIVQMGLQQLVDTLTPSPERCLAEIHELLPQLAAQLYQEFVAEVHSATRRLMSTPADVEEFAELLSFLQLMEERRREFEDKNDEVVAHYDLIKEFNIAIPPMDNAAYQTMEGDVTALRDAMCNVDAVKETYILRFSAELDAEVERLNKDVIEIRHNATDDRILDPEASPANVVPITGRLVGRVEELRASAQRIVNFQRLFKVTETLFPELDDCEEEVQLLHLLWTSLKSWAELTDEMRPQPLASLDAGRLEETVMQFTKTVQKIERNLAPNRVTPVLKGQVTEWRELLPVLANLRNPELKDRHWARIEDALGQKLVRDDTFTVSAVLALQVARIREQLSTVATEASQEAGLEEMLRQVQDKWSGVEFTVRPYKETKDMCVLGSVDDVMALLEDSLVMMATISASRFVSGIRGEVEKMEKMLCLFSDTMDEWLDCQKSWMYLESIFTASDIQRQLPTETKNFQAVDRQFKEIMRRTRDRPNALQAGTTHGWLETLHSCNQSLETVQKSLADYLEVKCTAFPRFYFLSADELLEILSQTRNVRAVQPHLQKCFDGIRLLEFGEGAQSPDILAMLSGEGERVALGKNLKARGAVESWLTAVETQMRAALKAATKKGLKDYASMERLDWVRQQPAQLVIVVSNIFWCKQVEECFTADEPLQALQAFYQQNVDQLTALCGLVRGGLSQLERKIMVALITVDVHNRDIVETLVAEKCVNKADFGWQRQLRYEYDAEEDNVNARFVYGHEYLGAQPRLVVTPMTDRCYMTLTGALHMHLGGAPAGPAGTGKTETTKDLGKALGVQCVVFNCGENLDYQFMGKFFAGLAQCGAWACFDEFNRIDIEVLSVVAQQLLTIQTALKAGLAKFNFEGREMRMVPTCGVFITMNPGYAGRTELPDNLKALFRPMAMMIPDYAMVAEVMLFSEGFATAKTLSRKMVNLYKLASEQLSQQDHYDFGMRALKSVLTMAGGLKRSTPDLSEEFVLIRAMQDSNIPKLLAGDALLFNAIVSDLFPGVSVPAQDVGELEAAVVTSCNTAGLQPVPPFVLKVIQLYETFNVRFGVMLVGLTGGGKTCCYRMLQAAMTLLRAQGCPNPDFQAVHTHLVNPKAVSLGELYGEFNELTHEWRDGVASQLIRTAVADASEDRQWVVFDGPVDAVWIESMNTVLDDNCTLCLPNGERIKLNPATMRMLFEVGDLAAASPATVSRCGMVYVPPEDCGWRPFVRSWLAKLPAVLSTHEKAVKLAPEDAEFIDGMFERWVDPGLAFVRKHCSEPLRTANINLVAALTSLFQSLLHPSKGIDVSEPFTDYTRYGIQNIFAFCYVWSLGGGIDASCRDKFDHFVRTSFQGFANFPAGSGTVYDYGLDPERNFALRSWEQSVPSFKYDAALPYFQLVVPTVDTVRYSFLLAAALDVHKPMLLAGPSGVGKTAVILDTLQRLGSSAGSLLPVVLNFSAQTSSAAAQAMIEGKLERKRKNRYGAPHNKRVALFVDDVNMPARETYGAQPPVELLRQLQDMGGFYDRSKLFWKDVEDVTLVAACGPPGGGRQEMSTRFLRHFHVLCMPPPSEAAMRGIFTTILGGFLDATFPLGIRAKMAKPMVECSVELYLRICEGLLPTPAKSHYTYNLRDLSKVFQGIMMIRAQQCPDAKTTLTRLWVHENLRVFHDRLVCQEDKDFVTRALFDMLRARFEVHQSYEEVFGGRDFMFGDYMRMGAAGEERVYEEVQDQSKLARLLAEYQDQYNLSTSNHMDLVFFKDAIEHISRIARILRQPRGNALLVGVGGSGKQSLTRFACHMAEAQCFQIQLSKGYGSAEFHEDLKKLYNLAGIGGKPVVFMFNDNQIVNEGFVEDINNMLNSGEVPGLFTADEREKLMNDIRPYAESTFGPQSPEGLYRIFMERVRDNLHIVLCMSPVGDSFRVRCRQFPSLINCTTIDWFSDWPAEALRSVSSKFLEDVELGGEAISQAVAEMCVDIHTGVAAASERFFQELRRRYYTTPKSYLDLISMYTSLLHEQRTGMQVSLERLLNGLEKLRVTNETVDRMEKDLKSLQPVLQERSESTQRLLLEVTREQKEAEQIRVHVANEEAEVARCSAETTVLKDDAQRDLEEVLPALEAAQKALNALNKNDIIEIKTFQKPPTLVQLTMEGVCILLQEKADWDTAKRVLGDAQFIKRLVAYDADNIPERVVQNLKRVIDDPHFTPDQVAKQSNAARSMCLWVRAMDVYARCVKLVEPKRQALCEAEVALEAIQRQLAAKQAQLGEVVARVEGAQVQLAATQAELDSLRQQVSLAEKRLSRSGKLISALADESVRWASTAAGIQKRLKFVVGDVFLAAACMSYTGAFTGPYRAELVASWVARCQQLQIPISPDFSLQATLGTPGEIREWGLQGLPIDTVSIDNGMMATRGKRWPLMIDPQNQANKWVKALEARSALRVIRPTEPNLLRAVENSIRVGTPLLIEDMGESIDPALQPLLQKQLFKQGNRTLIRLGGSDIDYDPNFKLYMISKLPNPHYLPEVCITVTLIDFTVTIQGLEEQLLGEVVRRERAELEEAKDRLLVSLAADTRQLSDLQDRILKLLKESEGNILDDEALINTLNNSKLTSAVIQTRVKEAQLTEKEIDTARERYRAVPVRGAILYFVIADLALVDPMYQYSLSYFIQLFNHCIAVSDKSDHLPTRLQTLMDHITLFMYNMVCRGLFEAHKLMFSFLICTAIQRQAQIISPVEWSFLIRGARAPDMPSTETPDPSLISTLVWAAMQALEQAVPRFQGLCKSVAADLPIWRKYFASTQQHADMLPLRCQGKGEQALGAFHKLLLLKVMRPEALLAALRQYVADHLGQKFVESQPMVLSDIYKDSEAATPVIFILSTGSAPIGLLRRLAESRDISEEKFRIISLGQGQGPYAEGCLNIATKSGGWVCLQNCHLARSWMPELQRLCEELQTRKDVHPDFRLWLTSMPSPHFPVAVLQNGIKVTMEPPRGVRANLLRTYTTMPEGLLASCPKQPQTWRSLVFAMAFFHAVVLERRKFGPLGWNIRYDFSEGDLQCSLQTLQMFLEEQEVLPWPALQYVVGQINYGGRVTDDNDRALLTAILHRLLGPAVLQAGYSFVPGSAYSVPADGELGQYLEQVRALPLDEAPEVFGMHKNADIAFRLQETHKVIETILSIQPRIATAAGEQSPDDVVASLADEILQSLPASFSHDDASIPHNPFAPLGGSAGEAANSLGVVLQQEMDNFNKLLAVLRRTLADLQKAVKGLVVMSSDLELMYTCLLNNRVPELWARVAYPSLMPLAAWTRDLQDRCAFVDRWLRSGQPASFWLPALFYPQGFLTAVLQNHARMTHIAIDRLGFDFAMLRDQRDQAHAKPEHGVLVHGLFLEAARWDPSSMQAAEALPGQMYSPLSTIHFIPREGHKPPPDSYPCPLYKTSARAGVLSTTGQSTNFVLHLDLPIAKGQHPDKLRLQGVAAVCAPE